MTQGCRIDRGSLTIPSLEHTQLQLLTMAKLPVPLGAMPPESSQNQPLSCRAALSA
jgi:hypothetical protein